MAAILGNYIDNLNGIYAAKGSIKTVLETESNDLAYYSTLITNKLETSYTTGYSYGYDLGYDIGYSDGEAAAGDTQWELFENVHGSLNDLSELGGTEEVIDLYWGTILDNFSREEIVDERDPKTVLGYRFEWDENPVTIEEGGNQVEKTIHVVHEEMVDDGTWPESESGYTADTWFGFACEDGDASNTFISDFYGNIYPVYRDVTIVPAEQGSEYDYELNFDSLVYENYQGDMGEAPETINANGLYITAQFAGVNVDVESSGGSLDPNDDIVKDASKWQVFNYLAPNYNVMSLPTINDYAIEAMDIEWYAELCDNLGAPAVVAVDMFNPMGTVEVIAEGQGITTDYQMNDPEDPDINAYISIDIDLDEGQSVGLSFAQSTDDGNGAMFLDNIYWCLDSNTNGTHWLMNATTTGTYNILLEADGNGGCTMTITEPEPEP